MELNASFTALVEEALRAFSSDVEYAVEMMEDARGLEDKRKFFIESIVVTATPVAPTHKECPSCHEVKELKTEYYRRSTKQPHLFQTYCKTCLKKKVNRKGK